MLAAEILLAFFWLQTVVVGFQVIPRKEYRKVKRNIAAAAREHNEDSMQVKALQRELELLRKSFSDHLIKSHDERLELLKEHAETTVRLEEENKVLQTELDSTRRAFGEYMKAAHEKRIEIVAESQAELERIESELRQVRQNHTDFVLAANKRLLEATAPFKEEIEQQQQDYNLLLAEFDELKEAFNTHVEDSDTLIEQQSTDLNAARRALAAVASGLKLAESSAEKTDETADSPA